MRCGAETVSREKVFSSSENVLLISYKTDLKYYLVYFKKQNS